MNENKKSPQVGGATSEDSTLEERISQLEKQVSVIIQEMLISKSKVKIDEKTISGNILTSINLKRGR